MIAFIIQIKEVNFRFMNNLNCLFIIEMVTSYPIGWIYSVRVKTQAILPVQTSLKGKIILSINGEKDSLNDAVLGSGRFHAGGEDIIELKSIKRLGEVIN